MRLYIEYKKSNDYDIYKECLVDFINKVKNDPQNTVDNKIKEIHADYNNETLRFNDGSNYLAYKPFKAFIDYIKYEDEEKFKKDVGRDTINSNTKIFLKKLKEYFDNAYRKKLEIYNNDAAIEKNKKKNFVFIIDEINRGEISKIFGELFFAIDPGYRGVKGKVLTQYSNLIDDEAEKYFYIPENVYIIGTMNDIDRSVESMDFAMRRRFAWKEIKAEDTQDMLDSMFDDNNEIIEEDKQLFIKEAKERMNALNNAIEQIESFNLSYHIGASYFLKFKNYYKSSSDNKDEAFDMLWENHLKGILFEYLRGMPDASTKLDDLEDIYNGLIDEDDA